jgi:hypothetical protein
LDAGPTTVIAAAGFITSAADAYALAPVTGHLRRGDFDVFKAALDG